MNNQNMAVAKKEQTLNDLTKEISNILSSSINIAQETEEFLFGLGPAVKEENEEPHDFKGYLEVLYHKAGVLNSLLSSISQRLY